jgi:hypothetical protein
MTEFTTRVYHVVRDHGPLRASAITRLVMPDYRGHMPNAAVGGALGKLKRAGLIGFRYRDGAHFAIPDQATDQ